MVRTCLEGRGFEVPLQRTVEGIGIDTTRDINGLRKFLNRLDEFPLGGHRSHLEWGTYSQRPLNTINDVTHETYWPLQLRVIMLLLPFTHQDRARH